MQMDIGDRNSSITYSNNSRTTVYALPLSAWIVLESCSLMLITVSCFVFLVLLRFTYLKSRKAQRKQQNKLFWKNDNTKSNNRFSRNASETSSFYDSKTKRKRSSATGQSAKSLRLLCLLAGFFALLRISADQLELATYGGERIDCKIYQVTVVVTYALSATCIYSALWLRLQIFFRHPIMKQLASSSVIICLIWLALFSILSSSFINTTIFVITVRAVDSIFGCALGETISLTPTLRYVILTLSTVISQGVLLSLFLYPLLKHRHKIRSISAKSSLNIAHPRKFEASNGAANCQISTASENKKESRMKWNRASGSQLKRMEREKKLLSVIFRVLISALVCVISDVVTAVITIALNNQPRVVSNMVFNVNLMVNLISVLYSFGDWKQRFFPCCTDKKFENDQKQSRVANEINFIHENAKDENPNNNNHYLKSAKLNFDGSKHYKSALSFTNGSETYKNDLTSTPTCSAISKDDSLAGC